MIYFIADTHFGHENVIKYENRPFKTVYEMNETIINNWNKTVKADDIIYHLGDFGFGNKTNLIEIGLRLNGNKKLIVGNHDFKYSDTVLHRFGFNEVIRGTYILNNKYLLSHQPKKDINYINLFGHVHNAKDIKTFSQNSICLCVERWNYTPVSLEKIKSCAD